MIKNFTKIITPVENEKINKFKIFFIAFFLSSLIFLPFVIYNKGVFLFYGDYNLQQIPFYKLAHLAVKQGNFGLNWTTDLGSDFIGSYSFYLLGSPFFWLTIPFKNSVVPYLMAPLFVLKFSTAALSSYMFIRKFTKTPNTAFFAALLYAFSGYSIYNVFFNHFHEIIAFFPFLLVSFENLLKNKKRGFFALAVGINLIINFYFFVAEVVFLAIYFLFRVVLNKNIKMTKNLFISFLIEFLIGISIGFILFLPSAAMVLKNPRVSKALLGFDMLFYPTAQRYALFIQCLFFPPDMPSLPNFFQNAGAVWGSVSAYMPMFGATGFVAFLKGCKKSWLKNLIICLFIFLAVPFLNSAFNGFNASFYARWFFALTLTLALATAIAIEKYPEYFKFSAKISFFIFLCFFLIGIIPKKEEEKIVFFNLPNNILMFWINSFIAVFGVFLSWFLIKKNIKNSKSFYSKTFISLIVFIITYSTAQFLWGITSFKENNYEDIFKNTINCKINFEDDEFFRIDVLPTKCTNNLGMALNKPSVSAFQSTVSPSIMSFYNNIGIKRDVMSKIPEEGYDNLRNFLSVKYILIKTKFLKQENIKIPENFEFFKEENNYKIYKNKNFIKMGFLNNNYIEKEEFLKLDNSLKEKAILNSVVLSKEQIKKYKNFLKPTSKEEIQQINDTQLKNKTNFLKENCCEFFKPTSYGFSAKINLKEDGLVVFSVPFEKTYSAKVNKKSVFVENVDFGLMAIQCKKGENKIEFFYKTPGLKISILISTIGIFSLIAYVLIFKKLKK